MGNEENPYKTYVENNLDLLNYKKPEDKKYYKCKVIGFSGKAEHGKTSMANIMKMRLEAIGKKVLMINNADYLKFIAKEYFGWNGNKDEEGRGLLQKLGTDIIRIKNNQFDFHVESVYRIINLFKDEFDYFLIPDCRFLNEYEYLLERNVNIVSVRVNRINYKSSLTEEQLKHISETALDEYNFNYVFNVEEGLENVDYYISVLLQDLVVGRNKLV